MDRTCKLEVIIGGKLLKTVNEIIIENDVKNLGASCSIYIPINCKYKVENQILTDIPQNAFKKDDKVTVTAWYENFDKITVFEGFIRDFIIGDVTKKNETKSKIFCLDYLYVLQKKPVNKSWQNVHLKEVLDFIVKDTEITIKKPYIDLTFDNLQLPNMTAAGSLEFIKKMTKLTISLFGKELYINIAKNTLNQIELDTSKNILECDLQKNEGSYTKYKVQAWKKEANGTKKAIEVGEKEGEIVTVDLQCINSKNHQKIVDNSLTEMQLGNYQGTITTPLYPNANLLDKIKLTNVRYPDQNGTYIVRSIDIELNEKGFHRKLKVAYITE